jgi:predicted nucleotidyltransferase
VLYRVNEVLKSFGKVLKALVIFGSSAFSRNPNDIDLLVVVNKLSSVNEKIELELSISRSLRDLEPGKPFDVVVLDVEMLKENMVVGSFLTGLVLGYRVVYDEIGFDDLVKNLIRDLTNSTDDYVLIKRGRKVNLKAIAIAKSLASSNSLANK